ncbi:Cell division protein FtsZ [uncultured Gammaproteobacteria bacterium]
MINLTLPRIETELKPRITVFGVGGAGGNAVNNMIKANLEGVEFVVGNTDAQALNGSLAQKRLQLGVTITRGLGAGSRPDVGRAAAEEQFEEVSAFLDGANMVFITAGMGGGTGTGAAPVIARAARERGLLTVGVVTKPFHFEGAHRMRSAEQGIAELQQFVDTLIIIPNQNLFRIANEKTTFADAFKLADEVLHAGVRGVTDLMVMPGLINLDFADIRSVMTEMGKAMMGTGEAGGERRAISAAEAAISNPLLDDVSMKGARGVLINITGGYDMTLFEVDEAANRIRDEVDPDANIIFGSTFDASMEGVMRVSVVATGIDAQLARQAAAKAAQAQAEPPPPQQTARQQVAAPAKPGIPGRPVPPRPLDYHSTLVASPMPAAPAGQHGQGGQGSAAMGGGRGHDPDATMDLNQFAREAGGGMPVGGGGGGQQRRDGSFIPPRPAEAGQRPQQQMAPPAPQPPARSEAEDRNVRRGMRLFPWLGGGARRRDEPEAAPVPPQQAPAVRHGTGQSPADAHGAGSHGAGAPRMPPADEDVLDIPAFLRRQAN